MAEEFKEFKVATTVEDYAKIDVRNIRYTARFLIDNVRAILYKVYLYKVGIINQRQLFKLVSTDFHLFGDDYFERLYNIEFGGREAARVFIAAREYVAHGIFDQNDPKVLEDCLIKAICLFEKLAHI